MRISISSVSIMNFFTMLGLAIVFAVDKTFFIEASTELYDFYLAIAPQVGYAIVAFCTAILLFASFILKNKYIEIVGLFVSGLFTIIILSGYLLSFPNIGSVILAVWTLTTFMTIADMIEKIQEETKEETQ